MPPRHTGATFIDIRARRTQTSPRSHTKGPFSTLREPFVVLSPPTNTLRLATEHGMWTHLGQCSPHTGQYSRFHIERHPSTSKVTPHWKTSAFRAVRFPVTPLHSSATPPTEHGIRTRVQPFSVEKKKDAATLALNVATLWPHCGHMHEMHENGRKVPISQIRHLAPRSKHQIAPKVPFVTP